MQVGSCLSVAVVVHKDWMPWILVVELLDQRSEAIVHEQVSHLPLEVVGQPFAVVAARTEYQKIEEVKVHQRIDSAAEVPAVVRRVFLCEVSVPSQSLLECRSKLSYL